MHDPYVYPGTDVLKNILDIQGRKKLDDAEDGWGLADFRTTYNTQAGRIPDFFRAHAAKGVPMSPDMQCGVASPHRIGLISTSL